MNNHNRLRRGFTAVEMLATAALASILMIAVLGVIASIGRTRATIARHDKPELKLPDVVALILQDLKDARSMDIKGQVLLFGYGAIDPVTLAHTHRPAEVRYLVRRTGSFSVLVREQRTFDARTGVQVFDQLVAMDVASITMSDLREHQQVRLIIAAAVPTEQGLNRLLILE